MRVALYYALLLVVLAYAVARGGRDERVGVGILLVGSVLTHVAFSPMAGRFSEVEVSVLAVDLAVLAAFGALALTSDRYWPLWIAAFQLIGVLAHVAKLAEPEMFRTGYAFILAVWSYPMLGLIAWGTHNQHRQR